jgi:predicted phosphodiesterase
MLAGCVSVPNSSFEETKTHFYKRQFLIWMLSDIQPKTTLDRNVFEAAVADVNENIGSVDMGIMAGDLLKSRSHDDDFNWLIQTRNKANVTNWYQIAGNHDVRSGPIFYKYFPQAKYYALTYGNLLFLFLSDQSMASRTDISDDTFLWWKDMVESNREKIIITVSHAQLKNSGLTGSIVPSRVIHNSKRFETVLKQEKVALWVSGHSHLPQVISGPSTANKNLGGTFFVNVGTIDDVSFLDSESRFFYFHDGSDVLWIRSRNHSKRLFNSGLDLKIPLGKPFSLGSGKPQVL